MAGTQGRDPTLTAVVGWTLALSVGAAWATFEARWPGRTRLEHPIFNRLLAFDDQRASLAILAALLLVVLVPRLRSAGGALADALGRRPNAAIGLAFVGMVLATQLVYLNHALSMDEYAPRLQAHAFAQGELVARYPAALTDRVVLPGSRGNFLLADPATGRVASAYWPGLALLMAPLAAVDLEWLLNPALSALALWLIFSLATEIGGDRRAGGWALLFALASPAFTVNAISFYAMPGLLTLDLLFAWLLLRGGIGSAALAGLVGGFALVLHNPVPHVLFAAPWLLWLALERSRWPRLAAVLAGYVPFGLGIGLGWPLLIKALGLDRAQALQDGHGFVADWLQRLDRVFNWPTYGRVTTRIDATWKAWIWSMPGLLVLFALALRRRTGAPWTGVLAASLVLTYGGYFLVDFSQGHGWGYRYLHSAWGALPVVAGACVGRRVVTAGGDAWRSWCGGLALAGLLVTPLYLWQVRANIAESLALAIEAPATGRWLVFVTVDRGRYTTDLVQNLPGQDRVRMLASRGATEDAALVARQFAGARLTLSDSRGSLWRLPGP